ncbi:MAG: hypothetical protein JW715_05630 [Sedimentisphaerales bacterium]|nr:hypothetical protein [Sedimentisphaerales bacterium]
MFYKRRYKNKFRIILSAAEIFCRIFTPNPLVIIRRSASICRQRQVKAPIDRANAGTTQPGMFSGNNSSVFSTKELFESFSYHQGYDLTADKIIIIDETGLP